MSNTIYMAPKNRPKLKSKILKFLPLLILLTITPLLPTKAASEDIQFPNYEREELIFPTDSDNDIFLKPVQFHQLVNYNLAFNASSMNQRSYNSYSRGGATSRGADSTFTIGNTGIYEFSNTTNAAQELKYTRNYFGLIDNSTEDIRNALIENGNPYLVSFNLADLEPVSFEFLFSQISGATTLTLTLNIIDPKGNFDSINVNIIKGISQIVPFVPLFTGEHYLAIESNRDAIMEDMRYITNSDISSISTGITEHFDQDNTLIRYYRTDSSGQAQVIDFDAIIFQNEYFASDFSPNIVFGDLRILVFDPNYPMFGSVASSLLITASEDFYIALVAIPADNNDPLIRKVRSEQGLEMGMDIDLTMTLRKYQVNELLIGADFTADAIDPYSFSSNSRFYSFRIDNPVLLGVNGSTNDDLVFTSNNPEIGSFSVNNLANNILNDINDDAVILPAGTYSVEVSTEETYFITAIEPNILNIDVPETFSGTLGDVVSYYLPSNMVVDDRLDFTYLDTNNESVSYEIVFYDVDGTKLNDLTDTMEYWYNAVNNLVFTNQTSQSHNRARNLQGIYFKMEVTGNEKYINGTLAYSDETNITSQVEINRVNEYNELQEGDPNGAYFYDVLNQALMYDLSSNNATIEAILDFTAGENKAYKLRIDTTNRTIVDFDIFVTDTTTWFNNLNALTIVNISNIDHYILELTFASNIELHMGMYLTLGTQVANGSLDINLFEVALTEFPQLNVGSLNAEGISSSKGENGKDILSNPLFYAAVVSGIGIIAGIIYYLSKRGAFKRGL